MPKQQFTAGPALGRAILAGAAGAALSDAMKTTKSKPRKKSKAKRAPRDNVFLEIDAPASKGVKVSRSPARISYRPDGSRCIIGKREFLSEVRSADVSNPDGFTANLNGYFVNPSSARLFPWASQIALRFSTYRIRKLALEYVPFVSTSVAGAIVMGFDPSSLDLAPSTKAVMFDYEDFLQVPVWQRGRLEIKPSSLNKFKNLYVQPNTYSSINGAWGAPQELTNTYNAGTLFTSLVNVNVSTSVGELYVDYEFELDTPQMNDAALEAPRAAYASNSGSLVPSTLFADAARVVRGFGVGQDWPQVDNVWRFFPSGVAQSAGRFTLVIRIVGVGITAWPTSVAGSNINVFSERTTIDAAGTSAVRVTGFIIENNVGNASTLNFGTPTATSISVAEGYMFPVPVNSYAL